MNNLDILIERYPQLAVCKNDVRASIDVLIAAYENGGKLLLCGNGGSCADCDHIVGELMKGFLKKRPIADEKRDEMKRLYAQLDDGILEKLQCGLPAISLPSITALGSAFNNDVDPDLTYAQSTFALGRKGDVLIAISTSGNAKNVAAAAKVARAVGMTVIALTGANGGKLAALSDISVRVPETETYKVQELHLPLYHAICADVEEHFFKS
ncbi:MAG: SIS domain-containing protein [Clostridia bacterium]|nr:SIS domain-containing protein [Clostridia bacterium]